MTQIPIEQLDHHITTFNFDQSPEVLGQAWKIAKTLQDYYRVNSDGHRLLSRFQEDLLRKIRSLRKGPSIEELDEQAKEQTCNSQ